MDCKALPLLLPSPLKQEGSKPEFLCGMMPANIVFLVGLASILSIDTSVLGETFILFVRGHYHLR
jgi:hypothetical protein